MFDHAPSGRFDLAVGELRGIPALDRMWDELPDFDLKSLLGSYPGTQGTALLARSLAELRWSERGERLDPAGFVASHGALDGLSHALAPLPPSSPVLYATPGFILDVPIARAGHIPQPIPWRLADHTAVWLDCVEEAVAAASRPVGLIVNFPRNPSGALASAADWVRIGRLVDRYNVLLVIDDVYGFLDPTSRPPVVDPDRVVIVDSLSKRMAAPGLRLGYVHSSPSNVAAVRASAAQTSVGVSPLVTTLGALAVKSYIGNAISHVVKTALAERRSRVREAVGDQLGWRLVLSDHGFYGCVQLSDAALCDDYMAPLRDRGVSMSAGRDARGAYLRFCIGAHARVDEALTELAKVCAGIDGSPGRSTARMAVQPRRR